MKLATKAAFHLVLSSLSVFLILTGTADAHHVMGGQMPSTFSQGLLSGLAHPVIGFDHLAALVAVGLIASRFPRGLLLPIVFVAAVMGGVAMHLRAADLPYSETLVGVSVVLLGAAVLLRASIAVPLVVALFAAAGFLHGYALAESIVGAEPSPLAAYLLGLLLLHGAISVGVLLAARAMLDKLPRAVPQAAALLICLVGCGAVLSSFLAT